MKFEMKLNQFTLLYRETPISNLWFLDSGDEDCLGIDGWDW